MDSLGMDVNSPDLQASFPTCAGHGYCAGKCPHIATETCFDQNAGGNPSPVLLCGQCRKMRENDLRLCTESEY